MKGIRNVLLKTLSTVMAVAFFGVSMFSVTVSAAAPVITVKNDQASAGTGGAIQFPVKQYQI